MSSIEELEHMMRKKEIDAVINQNSSAKKHMKHLSHKPEAQKKSHDEKKHVKLHAHKSIKDEERKKILEKIKKFQQKRKTKIPEKPSKEKETKVSEGRKPGGSKNMKKQIKEPAGQEEKKKPDQKHEEKGKKDFGILESYKIEVDKAAVNVEIEKTQSGTTYNLKIPKIEIGTQALLDEIRKELVSITSFNVSEIVDKESVDEVKKRFMNSASALLEDKMPGIRNETKDFLIGILMQEMLGLGKIEFLINDPGLEEIVVISSKEPVRIYHKKYGWLATNLKVEKEEDITNYSNIIARRVGRQITVLTPLLDAHITTGDRANAVLYPISTKGNTITIRKFARDPWTIIDLIQNKTVSLEVASLLWLAIEYEMNIIISGGTASGKTVFLNACMPFIPPNHRIISIEDTRELMLPDFLYWCPLVTRTPNPEGKGEVSMLDLLVNSLRMRPDRIILGEMRKQGEAEVLFEAMHTGHSVYATLHADTAAETISRLTNPPINIAPNLIKAVNLNVVMFRDRKKGIRRVLQLAEFIPGNKEVSANILYRWVPEKDEILVHNTSLALFEDLSRHTGMSQAEINKDIKDKMSILEWLVKNKIRSLEQLGNVVKMYYTSPNLLEEIMQKNQVDKLNLLKA